MTTALIGGGVVAFVAALAIWLAVRQAKQAGAASQAATDARLARETEAAIHEVQAETRDTGETVVRLRKGNF
ncbi:MAG: hypothetical protein HYX36_05240 [Rhizobiales bacterium]|nr:hypothetical protein [Hyphomicrobiales bacterium]